ncbi:hypothetical protein EJB14_18800, partial [Bacillus pumilus]|uniref:hypothetical protein n=1 Tax=Bacillus pumilus TaxID=1408 RepID=UPI000FB4B9FD
EARLAEEARAAEEARLAEEARAAEEARLAEEARVAEEAAEKKLYVIRDEILSEIEQQKLDFQNTIELQKYKELKAAKEKKKQDKYLKKMKRKQRKISFKPINVVLFLAALFVLMTYVDVDLMKFIPKDFFPEIVKIIKG